MLQNDVSIFIHSSVWRETLAGNSSTLMQNINSFPLEPGPFGLQASRLCFQTIDKGKPCFIPLLEKKFFTPAIRRF